MKGKGVDIRTMLTIAGGVVIGLLAAGLIARVL